MNLEDYKPEEIMMDENGLPENMEIEDKWILSKLNTLAKEIKINMENYDLGVALDKIEGFIWNEFCDWYIEIVKTRLYNKEESGSKSRKSAQFMLNKVLCDSLKLLHPFMPFVTEKIYLELYNNDASIMIANYPEYKEEYDFKEAEESIEQIKEAIVGIRNVRTKMNVHPAKKSTLIFITKKYKDVIKASDGFLKKLGFAENIEVKEEKKDIPKNAVNVVTSEMEIFIPFTDLVDIKEEILRLEKEKEKIIAQKEITDKMLGNPGFVAKAPESKVAEEKAKQEKFNEMLQALNERIENLKLM